MNSNNYKIEIKLSIGLIDKNIWDSLSDNIENPFFKWQWLHNLETSKSVSQSTGWQPIYFLAFKNEELQAIAPLFLKNHSFGEFIFDHSFARLAKDLDLNYYPKLIGMSPYSPIEGYQFLYKDNNIDRSGITSLLLDHIELFALKNKILSCNFLYVNDDWGELLTNLGYHHWINTRSEWEARGERTFTDFLNRFNSNQRKNIKKERKSIIDQNIHIRTYKAENIDSEILKTMHYFYEKHCLRWGVWGSKYLTYNFFKNLEHSKENLLIFGAFDSSSNNPTAMSMCVKDKHNLWGRYWGSIHEINNLHFELCYYKPIEWCIQNNIKYFDPGAGGNHKRRRGFYAKVTKSFHKWFNPEMENLLSQWLQTINEQKRGEIMAENESMPFKK